MPTWTPWAQKPPRGTLINLAHPWVGGANLLGFWAFNESSGPTVLDVAGNTVGTFGPTTNAPSWVNSSAGIALNFLGSSNQFVASTLTRKPTQITISAYAALTANNSIVSEIVSTNSANVELRYGGTNGAQFEMFSGSAASGTSLLDSKFHFLSGTYDGANIKLYIDNKAPIVSAFSTPLSWSSQVINFGERPGSTTLGFTGLISWIAIWGSALPSSVQAIFGSNPNAIWQMFQPNQSLLFKASGVTSNRFRRTLYDRVGSRGTQ